MTRSPALSVVIPTRDRRDRLAETLAALEGEAVEGGIEVLVVDDGSRDSTRELLARHRSCHGWRSESGPPRGPAAARNRGVAMASGDRVLFLGDDTRPAPGCLAAHLEMAGDREVAVQGRIDWDPEAPISEVMRFLAPEGPQFYFRGLADGGPVAWTGILGSNLSAPRRWLVEEPYDEGFPYAALEDTELALRWRRRGWGAVHAAGAIAWHHHPYGDIEPFLARQRRAGHSARHLVRRHPRAAWKLVVQPTLMTPWILVRRALLAREASQARWDLRCRLAFLTGFLTPAG